MICGDELGHMIAVELHCPNAEPKQLDRGWDMKTDNQGPAWPVTAFRMLHARRNTELFYTETNCHCDGYVWATVR